MEQIAICNSGLTTSRMGLGTWAIEGWRVDKIKRRDIDSIFKRSITDPVSPEFMAPPLTRPAELEPQPVY